ncbi:MAG: chromate efflux transporter [Myxococcales bacterium]|nr:chromate efflux transporter [Myxococcales bacterium]
MREGSALEVLATFAKLGLTSFGGPIAHLGYYRQELVEKRRWVSEAEFAELLALCQFLPGPASSQLGFCLGLTRAGLAGGLAAFAAFTLPSAALLFVLAALLPQLSSALGRGALHGLALVAVAVVAHGLIGMARQLCPDVPRAGIAIASALVLVLAGAAWVQLVVIAAGALLGVLVCRGGALPGPTVLELRYGSRLGLALLAVFALGLAGLPIAARGLGGLWAVADAFFRAGGLVFGGGHVVLPLLEEAVVGPGWVSASDFVAGYGAAQAVPGPMFSFAAYLGARIAGAGGALVALCAIFLPGLLLVAGVLPLWRSVASRPGALRAVAGVNAAVVGLLGAALYDPVCTKAIRGPFDVAVSLVGLALLLRWRASPLWVVLACVGASVARAIWLAPGG